MGEVATLSGRIGWRGLTAKEYTTQGPLFVSVHSLNHGAYVDMRDAFHISQDRYDESPEIMLREGDVLICKDGAGVGKVGIVGRLDAPATINSSLLMIRSGGLIDPKFLYYCLSSPYFQRIVLSRLNGATTPHLYQRDITEFPVVIPPPGEQRSIVAILDEAFEGVAAAKANAEQIAKSAEEVFEAHLEAVFTQPCPEWQEAALGEVCKFVGGSQPPKSEFITEYRDGLVRLIQIRDYKSDRHIVYIPKTMAKRFCTPEDVMIGRYGPPVFQILRGLEGSYNVALMKAVPDARKLSKDFLFYFLQHRSIQTFIIGASARAAGQSGLNKDTIEPYRISFPSLEAQSVIVGCIKKLHALTDALRVAQLKKIAALDELKKSLLHHAFAGELTARMTAEVLEAA